MADRRWKRHERQSMAALGATRMPSNGTAQPDGLVAVGGTTLAMEHKSRETLPGWLLDAVRQAVRHAPTGTLPVVGLGLVGDA